MATKTIKFKIISNLQVNDSITYQIWKTNNTRIAYGNGITVPNFRANTTSSAPYNFQLGATKEQTMQNWYNILISYNYSYTGLTYSYNGTDEIRVDITNADGFEHRINCIRVPNNIIVSTGTPCSTAYVYNSSILYNYFQQYSAGLTITKNGASYSTGNYPSQIDDEITRVDTYVYNSYPTTSIIQNYTVNIPRGLTASDVSHELDNTSALITIAPFTYFNYLNYYFNLNDGAYQTSRDIYGLLPNTTNNVDIIDKWGCELDYPITVGSLTYGFLTYPQLFVPVYNPMYFKFALPNFQEPGFRYLINLENERTGETIANFNIVPDIDGTGYIDISKYLSNFTTIDYENYETPDSYLTDCKNSYVKYKIGLGYELNEDWNYLSYTASTIGGITYAKLVQDDQTRANTFAQGDQISVSTLTGITNTLNGLHIVLEATPYSVTIDVLFPGTSSLPIGGTVKYADNRKTKYNDVYVLQNNYAWNGTLGWKEYRNYSYINYYIEHLSGEPDVSLLTSLDFWNAPYFPGDPIPNNANIFYIKDTQDFYFNFAHDTDDKVKLVVIDNFNNEGKYTISGTAGNVTAPGNGLIRQFKINFNELVLAGDISPDAEWIQFELREDLAPGNRISLYYRLFIDRRCRIEDYEILFMDRLGSLLSFAFPLRAQEKGKVERDMYNKYIDPFAGPSVTPEYSNSTLRLKDAGKTIYNVDVTKELELNTDWMTDFMSVLFEDLLTSPYTYIKVDGTYYPCIIKENSFEVLRQKNKNLIRKTITVEYSNKNAINI